MILNNKQICAQNVLPPNFSAYSPTSLWLTGRRCSADIQVILTLAICCLSHPVTFADIYESLSLTCSLKLTKQENTILCLTSTPGSQVAFPGSRSNGERSRLPRVSTSVCALLLELPAPHTPPDIHTPWVISWLFLRKNLGQSLSVPDIQPPPYDSPSAFQTSPRISHVSFGWWDYFHIPGPLSNQPHQQEIGAHITAPSFIFIWHVGRRSWIWREWNHHLSGVETHIFALGRTSLHLVVHLSELLRGSRVTSHPGYLSEMSLGCWLSSARYLLLTLIMQCYVVLDFKIGCNTRPSKLVFNERSFQLMTSAVFVRCETSTHDWSRQTHRPFV